MKDSNDDRFYYLSKAFWYIIKINTLDLKCRFYETFSMRAIGNSPFLLSIYKI